MVVDAAREQWPPPQFWPYQQATDFSEILKRLDAIDKAVGLKDCYEPKKDAFLNELADRISALEQKAGAPAST